LIRRWSPGFCEYWSFFHLQENKALNTHLNNADSVSNLDWVVTQKCKYMIQIQVKSHPTGETPTKTFIWRMSGCMKFLSESVSPCPKQVHQSGYFLNGEKHRNFRSTIQDIFSMFFTTCFQNFLCTIHDIFNVFFIICSIFSIDDTW
jgi:hypothetical protein